MPRPSPKTLMRVIRALGFVWAGVTVLSFLASKPFMGSELTQDAKKYILVAWYLVPPTYFFFEIHWVRRNLPNELGNCKMSQEAAAKIWAGVAAALTLIYFRC
jgi:hypothetical protein